MKHSKRYRKDTLISLLILALAAATTCYGMSLIERGMRGVP